MGKGSLKAHKTLLIIFYLSGLSFAAGVLIKGYHYYILPLHQRPHSPLHALLKPGGVLGHGLGIAGSTMMLLLFLYSVRKRELFGLRFGKIRYWLNIHIFFGIVGPVLVTLHTAFKFGGIVAISYFSMIAVMLSGFVGRYLYVQIPRALSGDELSMKEMDEKNKLMTRLLREKYGVDQMFLQEIEKLSGVTEQHNFRGLLAIFSILKNDLSRPFRVRKLKRQILQQTTFSKKEIHNLIELANQKAILIRKMTLLSSIQPLFHLWHVIHKPFAYIMIIFMLIHVFVTILFGYRWIF
ncbi:MAG: hypothetical protein D6813_00155 [Calditrichaeota bacterium]|nr:MAG: hypothetical protein D6813_00155 [Calditrichota bacterium]